MDDGSPMSPALPFTFELPPYDFITMAAVLLAWCESHHLRRD